MKLLILLAATAAANAWVAEESFASKNEVEALECKNGKGNLADGQEVTIETPNYPKNYPNKAKCNWKIMVPAGEEVHIWCENFDVVRGDFLRVLGLTSKLYGSFADGFGEILPTANVKRTLKFQFRSNKKKSAGGFRCQIAAVAPNNGTEPTTVTGSSCMTNDGPASGSACAFPFNYMGVSHTGCTTIDGDTRPWCITQTTANGDLAASGAGPNWGYCDTTSCPVQETATTIPTAPVTTAVPEPGCGSCCTECTSQILTQCSSTFSSTPPFYSTVHTMPNTILDTDPTAFVSVSTASDGIVDFMWGPDGWSRQVPAWQFTAKFKDQDQDTVISFDKDVGDATFCAPHALKLAEAVGRIPTFARTDFIGLDIRPGTWGNPSGCTAWGGSGVITMCLGVGLRLIDNGNIEELFLHEGSHISLDRLIEGTDEWLCARQQDKNFISTYARDHVTREDVAETLTPWYAVTHSSSRVPAATIKKIKEAIPARLRVLSSFLGDSTVTGRRIWNEISRKSNQTRPDDTFTPEVIDPYLDEEFELF